jgi:hypothetical protein
MPGNSEFHKAFNIDSRTPVINAAHGGNCGFSLNAFSYVSEQPYVSQRPYCNVLSTPGAFSSLPAGIDFHGLLRSYMETRSREWGGITSRTSVEYHDIQWRGGQTLSFPTGSTRQLGSINHMALDPDGQAYSHLFDVWIDYLISDPIITHPKIITLGYGGDLLLDEISMASVYWEPERNWSGVRRAVLVLAQMPKEGPSYDMNFSIESTAGKVREINTEFTGLIEYNTLAAKEIARTMMERMPLYNPAGRAAPAAFKKTTAVLDSIQDNGIVDLMNNEAKTISNKKYMG